MANPHEFSQALSLTYDHSYDIFLSFRGIDTRYNFTNHLHKALLDAKIATFLDEKEIEYGEDLRPELENAIRSSRASIVVFSNNYAYSRWCLNELVVILEQHKNTNHIIIPVFYHVDPADIKKLQGSFGDALAKHRQKIEDETNLEIRSQLVSKMELWKEALVEIAHLRGHDVNGWLETAFIEKIVEDIYRRLGVLLRCNLPDLTGMESHIRFISSWLKDRSTHTADILTIYGMGGIGKTSLAKLIYSLHCCLFQRSSFTENINRKCDKLLSLQEQLCADISKTSSVQVSDISVYTSMIEKALASKKVLIVLDDVDNLDQLKALLGKRGFHPGSKIIITTRDASLTEKLKLDNSNVRPKHIMRLLEGLDDISSLQLFSVHAFTCNGVKEGYEEVSKKLVNYCDGHPLALKVMGSTLCNRSLAEWEEYIDGLDKETDSLIRKVLQMSFDSLRFNNDKELFKHIACFFAGKDRVFAETILKGCDIGTQNGIRNLVDRCLLTIGPRNELKMHQLLQDMGKDFVRQEAHDRPWKRSRLWCHKESFDVLQKKKGKGNLKGIILDWSVLRKETLEIETDALRTMDSLVRTLEIETDALRTMDSLVLLQLNYVKFKGSYNDFPKELRWLCMHGFPSQSFPSDLPMGNLVVLELTYSKIEHFDLSNCNVESFQQLTGKKRKLPGSCSKDTLLLKSLKILNLSFCYQLRRLRGLSKLPLLERLILAGCRSLVEICESIGECTELVIIDLSYCIMLKKLPVTVSKLNKLEALSLDGCNLDEFPLEVTVSQASSSVTEEPPPKDVESVEICLARSLGCKSSGDKNWCKESYPMAFSSEPMLKELILDGNPIVFLPNCVRSLRRIELLSSEEHDMLKKIKNPPCTPRNLKFCRWDLLKKIKFDPAMSPITKALSIYSIAQSSTEIEGVVQIQPIARVKEDVIYGLDWKDLNFIKNQEVETWHDLRRKERSRIQLIFEFGIFSTFYGGKEIPKWFRHRINGSSISFTVPSSSKNIRGLNFCYLQTGRDPDNGVNLPTVIVSNITKKRTWMYKHYIHWVKVDEECLIWLSHWMLGKNEIENDDFVTISIPSEDLSANVSIRECGVSFVYDDGRMQEDVLGYYKSWNHIIGRDLSAFCLTTGEYLLDNHRFFWWHNDCPVYRPFIANGACYEGYNGMKELQLAILHCSGYMEMVINIKVYSGLLSWG